MNDVNKMFMLMQKQLNLNLELNQKRKNLTKIKKQSGKSIPKRKLK